VPKPRTTVTVFHVTRDKSKQPETERADDPGAIVYAHGGGGICLSAQDCLPEACKLAIECETNVFAVDFSSVPEHECPRAQMEFAVAVNHIYDNAASFGAGLDQERIIMCGVSGGAWVSLGAASVLAKAELVDKVRAHFLVVPMSAALLA